MVKKKMDRYMDWIAKGSSHHDASHDMVHIKNVLFNAYNIMSSVPELDSLSCEVAAYAALSHAICDRK